MSKWYEAFPTKDATAMTVVKLLEKEIFARYGIPELIVSDMAQSFESHLYKEVAQVFGIQIMDTSGYNAKANGQVERVHKDLGAMLRALMADSPGPESWEDVLPQVLFALRTHVSKTTGLAPYQILFGRDPATPLDVIFGDPEQDGKKREIKGGPEAQKYVQQLRRRIHKAHQFARDNLAKEVRRQRRMYHKEKKFFIPGMKCWLFTPRVSKPGESRKLARYWTGPWIVCSPVRSQVYVRITPDPSWSASKETKVVSIDRLKPYRDEIIRSPEEDQDVTMSGDEFAEAIPLGNPPDPPPGPPPGGGGGGGGFPPMPPPGPPPNVDEPLPDYEDSEESSGHNGGKDLKKVQMRWKVLKKNKILRMRKNKVPEVVHQEDLKKVSHHDYQVVPAAGHGHQGHHQYQGGL